MTKTWNEMKYEEKQQVTDWFSTWLQTYTDKVIKDVMPRRDEILANEFAMNLLKELHERTQTTNKNFNRNIGNMLGDFETFGQFDAHNDPLSHAGSYRDVLYDMYIA